MLSRVIGDLYYLKRIHSVVLDEKLGHTLKAKLGALDLHATPPPTPSALRQLLECLVYFQLENTSVTVNAIALVRKELQNMTGSQLSRTVAACCTLGQHDVSISAVPLLAQALPSMDSVGTTQLVHSLCVAGVRHEDTWSLLAEHCIRRMDSFTGKQLYRIIECFCEREVNYPDFYMVAERHICAQPSTYISMEHLNGVIECYRALGLHVMSLLAASSARSAEGFDSGLAAVAPARTRRGPRGEGGVIAAAAAGGDGASNHAVVATFLRSTLKAIKTADSAQLIDMLHKCEAKQVMHAEIMEAVAMRIEEIHTASPNVASTSALMRLMMRFEKPEWFVGASRPLLRLLDDFGEGAIPLLGHRMLSLAAGALKLFPADMQPVRFYTALVKEIKFDDVAASADAKRLPLLAGVMLSLRAYGGHALLEQNMSMISVAAANAPLRVQVELAAMLAPLPAAQSNFLPDLFELLSSQKNWVRLLTARDVVLLLDSLACSRLSFNDLLLVVVEYARKNLARFNASELVNILHHCAKLGFSDIEFYSSTATYVLEKATNSTVHDLCMLMYVFTFVLKGVIRVVQQMLPRLRVSASHTSSRDITLVLYSIVKLGILRHTEVTTPFCDRAVNILSSFKAEELASCLSSLRVLRFDHEGLLAGAAKVLGAALGHSAEVSTDGIVMKLTGTQIISIAASIVQLRRQLLLAEWQLSLQQTCICCLSSASATQTHLIAVTLAALDAVPCAAEQWGKLLQRANAVCQRFSGGVAAAEVLLALHDLMARDGVDDWRDIFASSALLAYAQSNMADIMANTEVRDRLRGKGLLTLLAGVAASFAVDEAERSLLRDIPLRQSLLLQHKTGRRATAASASRRRSRVLRPTSATPTEKLEATNVSTLAAENIESIQKATSSHFSGKKRSSSRKGAGANEALRESNVSAKRDLATGISVDFALESHGDVSEFCI